MWSDGFVEMTTQLRTTVQQYNNSSTVQHWSLILLLRNIHCAALQFCQHSVRRYYFFLFRRVKMFYVNIGLYFHQRETKHTHTHTHTTHTHTHHTPHTHTHTYIHTHIYTHTHTHTHIPHTHTTHIHHTNTHTPHTHIPHTHTPHTSHT
jgi:hypothetical protein